MLRVITVDCAIRGSAMSDCFSTITKMNTELKRHIGNTYSRIAMGQKKIAGQKSRGWFGIQLPQDSDFD